MSIDAAQRDRGDADETRHDRTAVDETYGPVSQVFGALASPLRAAIIHRLTDQEHSVAELVDSLGASQPLVSQHLGRLRAAGLVEGRRRGRSIVYRLADEHVAPIFLDAYQHSTEQRPTPLD